MIKKKNEIKKILEKLELRENPFHPLVFINGKPKTSPLSSPQAIEITIKNRIPVKTGPTTVWPNTIKNRKVSFLYKE